MILCSLFLKRWSICTLKLIDWSCLVLSKTKHAAKWSLKYLFSTILKKLTGQKMIKYSIIMCIYTLWSNKTYTNFFDSPMVNLPPPVLVPGIKNSVAKCYPWTSPIIPGEWCYSRFSLASLSLNFTTPTWELTFKSRRWLLREGMCRAPGHESKKWWHYVGNHDF